MSAEEHQKTGRERGHPARCEGCHGCGWMDGPPIVETVGGLPHRYSTVTPCTHDWWHQDLGWDPYWDDRSPHQHLPTLGGQADG